LGEDGRYSLATSEQNFPFHFLGWPTQQTGVLPRELAHTIIGSGLRLFMPASSGTFESSSGDSRAEKDTSMVVEIIKEIEMQTQLMTRLNSIKAMRVINYLHYTFNAGRNLIVLNGFHTMPEKLAKDFPGIERLLAREIGPLKFRGGPPNKVAWYDGTLLTLIVDKILNAYVEGNQNLLHRFLNVEL